MATGASLKFHAGVNRVIFVTGTDTNAGKTVLAALLTRHLLRRNVDLAAVKPFCSGGREDAEILHALQGDRLSLDEINPWHFKPPLAPMIAARQAGAPILKRDALNHLRRLRKRFSLLLIEGAGGLLSPLGDDFDARELIVELGATPVVVCVDRLGVVNQARLTMDALPRGLQRKAQLVLMEALQRDPSQETNESVLIEYFGRQRVHRFPRLRWKTAKSDEHAAQAVQRLAAALNCR